MAYFLIFYAVTEAYVLLSSKLIVFDLKINKKLCFLINYNEPDFWWRAVEPI